ncbi:MAG: winged helix-turn-helix domain-containing protein [Pikeienuella sp.]
MSRPKDKPRDNTRHAKPGLRAKVFVREDMIGGGKVELLRLLAEHGSITAAAKAMGVGYRRAWFLLDTLQRCFEAPLFTTERGGANAGGTQVTELGRDLIARHAAHEEALNIASADYLAWLETQQRQG